MKVNHLSFSYNHQSYMKDINIQFKDQKNNNHYWT